MAQYEEITIDKGADASIRLELVDANGSKKNLANYTIKGKIKKNYADSGGEATLFTPTILTPPADGVVTLTLTNAQTKALKAGRYVYDVEITASDSTITRPIQGIVTVRPNVTR